MKIDITIKDATLEEAKRILKATEDPQDDQYEFDFDAPVAKASNVVLAGACEDVEDADGLPWDERIHSSNHKKTAKGVWQRRKGITDETYETVVAELKGVTMVSPGVPYESVYAPATPVATVAPAIPATPVATVAPAIPATPVATVAPAIPATPVATVAPAIPATPVATVAPAIPATPVATVAPAIPADESLFPAAFDKIVKAMQNGVFVKSQLDSIIADLNVRFSTNMIVCQELATAPVEIRRAFYEAVIGLGL